MKNTKSPLIFIVDDDSTFAALSQNELSKFGYNNLKFYSSGEDCLKELNAKPDIVLLDYTLKNGMNGLDVLKKIVAKLPHTTVIMLTVYDKLEIAVDSIKLGAYDYVIKSETAFERIANLIRKIIHQNELRIANEQLLFGKRLVAFILIAIVFITGVIYYLFPDIF